MAQRNTRDRAYTTALSTSVRFICINPMTHYLILQVLGSSDTQVVTSTGRLVDGIECLKGFSLSELKEAAQINDDELLNDLNRVNFPLIKTLKQQLATEADLTTDQYHWGVILTDQTAWMEQQAANGASGEGWQQIVASDGQWWGNILAQWCHEQQIDYFAIPMVVSPQVPHGAADWEGMAAAIAPLLNQIIQFDSQPMRCCPPQGEPFPVDQIIIQHSSGTPALSSALYLWGVEQRLAKRPVDFRYVSVKDTRAYGHSGEHWQWRLKVPQVRQLVEAQDFSGAIALLSHPANPELADVLETLKQLDKAVSLNVRGLNLSLSPQEDVVERISIALWSEMGFRLRGQWMHWYLRVAGALELAIACLVQQQGQGQYEWRRDEMKTYLCHLPTNQRFTPSIKNVVSDLLDEGELIQRQTPPKPTLTYTATSITSRPEWERFKAFYYGNAWQLAPPPAAGFSFLYLRNDLYHALMGDLIDQHLDAQTAALGSVDKHDHPARLAVGQLRYIIKLAGLTEPVTARVNHYKAIVAQVNRRLA